jgi:hypothetical protein
VQILLGLSSLASRILRAPEMANSQTATPRKRAMKGLSLVVVATVSACVPAASGPLNPSPAAAPGPFGKISPADGGVNRSLAVTLSWQASAAAARYEYCLDATVNSSCDATWLDAGAGSAIDLTVPRSDLAYEWQVRARNADGLTEADRGSWRVFTVALGAG